MASKKYGLNPGCWAKHIGRDAQGAFFWDRMRVREPQLIKRKLVHMPEPCPACKGKGCVWCGEPCAPDKHDWGPPAAKPSES